MNGSTMALAEAKAAVDYAASVVVSLRCREVSLPKSEELARLQRVIRELEQRHSRLAKQYERLSHIPADRHAEGWGAFRIFYEDFLGRESRRRLETMEMERYDAKKTASTQSEGLHEAKRRELAGRGQAGTSGAKTGQERGQIAHC